MPGKTRAASEIAATLLLIAVAVAQLWPGISADLAPPIAWDHGSHLAKAVLAQGQLLPSLRGWIDEVELGVPLHTVYTASGTIWILLFRIFTPHLEWWQTYCLAFAGFRALTALAAYRLGRAAGAGALGSLVAGLITLADHGDHSEGGWFYDVQFGVWPMALAMCVFFFGLADLLAYLDRGKRATGVRAMLLLGIALFSHQASLLAIGSVLPALFLVRATASSPRSNQDLVRGGGVLVVGWLIACWWTFPMLGMTDWLDDHGQLYRGTVEMGRDIVAGSAVLRSGPWTNILVALGLGFGIFANGHRRTFALAAMLAMLIASPGWFLEFDASRFLPSLGRIVYPRMMMIAKPLEFALAGCVIDDLVRRVAPDVQRGLGTMGGRLGLALGVAILVPFAPDAPTVIGNLLVERSTTTTASLPEWNDRLAVWSWLRAQPTRPFFRVLDHDETTHLAQAGAAFSGHPTLVHGVLVGEAFRNTADTEDPSALLALNVRYVVTRLGSSYGRSHEVQRFGPFRVLELDDWSSEVVSGDAGRPRVLNFERERLVFEPNGSREIVVRRALAPGWGAYADGERVDIAEHPVPGSARLRLMRIDLPDGVRRVELRYEGLGARGVVGFLLTFLGLAATLAFAMWPRIEPRIAGPRAKARERLAALLDRIPWPLREHPYAIATALGVIVVTVAASRVLGKKAFAYELAQARVHVQRDDGTDVPCEYREGADAHVCHVSPSLAIHREQTVIDGRFHSCLTAHPPAGGTLWLEWDTSLRSQLVVGAGISDEAYAEGMGAPTEVLVRIDGDDQETLSVPNGRAWIERTLATDGGAHTLSIGVRAADPYRRLLCLDATAR